MVLTDGAIFLGEAFFCEQVALRVGQGLRHGLAFDRRWVDDGSMMGGLP